MYKLLILFFALLFLSTCNVKSRTFEDKNGLELSKIYCGSCHLYPEPGLLDKRTWEEFVLVRMASHMGIYTDNVSYYDKMPDQWIEPGIGGDRVRAAKIYPDSPMLSKVAYEKIRKFYLEEAPATLRSSPEELAITGLVPFLIEKPFTLDKSISPLVQSINRLADEIVVGQYQKDVYVYGIDGAKKQVVKLSGYVVDSERIGSTMYLLDMGTRIASDHPQGRILESDLGKDGTWSDPKVVLQGLMRPVSFNLRDLNMDGVVDFIVSEYGSNLGALSLYLSGGSSSSSYTRDVLIDDDGVIMTAVADLNDDGQDDIVALQANSDEKLIVFYGTAAGNYREETIARFLPTNGSTHFQLVDFDKDGDKDIIYSNGDNGDYTPILKPYHGVHVLINTGGEFSETVFLAMDGVYQAEAFDYDNDGDMDIAALSWHPDFNNPQRSFLLFLNSGNNTNFLAHNIKSHSNSRWMRFISSDLDEDGDVDIAISAMNIKTPDVPKSVSDKWGKKDEAFLLLENITLP